MSMARRDAEAFAVAQQASYVNAFVVSVALEMQTRRLTLGLYGPLHGGKTTYVATLAFFGTAAFEIENNDGAFPETVGVASFDLTYDEELGVGRAVLRGGRGWRLEWAFDGIAYEERAASIASLADDELPEV
jgi:hypothetical protein